MEIIWNCCLTFQQPTWSSFFVHLFSFFLSRFSGHVSHSVFDLRKSGMQSGKPPFCGFASSYVRPFQSQPNFSPANPNAPAYSWMARWKRDALYMFLVWWPSGVSSHHSISQPSQKYEVGLKQRSRDHYGINFSLCLGKFLNGSDFSLQTLAPKPVALYKFIKISFATLSCCHHWALNCWE